MKPVRLTVQAFGPFAGRQVIDFRAAMDAGLFGIYGRTGSGKSSLFNAITFALFGEAARREQEGASLRSDHAAMDVPTEVELVFDIGEKRYVSLRRPEQDRPKHRGSGTTRAGHEAFLFDATGLPLEEIGDPPRRRGKIMAEKKVRDVDAAVTALLGYGPDQFRQIVLLPQGRFETFLAAKTPERLEILRDLFDVSLFRHLAAGLKDQADMAERGIRDQRAFCLRDLQQAGFETPETLEDGLRAATDRYEQAEADARGAETAATDARQALEAGRLAAACFQRAEESEQTVTRLEADQPRFDALAQQVDQAGRARVLLEVEVRVSEAAAAVAAAEDDARQSRDHLEQAAAAEKNAREALAAEKARGPEREALRTRLNDLDRYVAAIEESESLREAVSHASTEAARAETALTEATAALSRSRRRLGERTEALLQARRTQARRTTIEAEGKAVAADLKAGQAYEALRTDLAASEAMVARLGGDHRRLVDEADQARQAFERAETALAAVQALHLARKLKDGDPCPVCGAVDHPAPPTGDADHIGLDQAFREARQAWNDADNRLRAHDRRLSAEQAVLRARRDQFEAMPPPPVTVAVLTDRCNGLRASLRALGPPVDPEAIETEIDGLTQQVAAFEAEENRCRQALTDAGRALGEARVRLEERLRELPEALRSRERLTEARRQVEHRHAALEAGWTAAEQASAETRQAAAAARERLNRAHIALTAARQRYTAAIGDFQGRLETEGVTETAYRALKPAIASLDADREAVQTFRADLRHARATRDQARAALTGLERPDLHALEAAAALASEAVTNAFDRRAAAHQALKGLIALRQRLETTTADLDAAERASGPLRALAALINGGNDQRLDLETFAIGALFDRVLEAANQRLGPMTANRYRLERERDGTGRARRGLGTRVFDAFTGRSRPTATLSGGETFIAALALALGLADVVESTGGKVRLDAVFIDEGFGSLDTENGAGTLDQVLHVLNTLVSRNRRVGVISHVPLVRDAIPNGFYVRKDVCGSSVETRPPGRE